MQKLGFGIGRNDDTCTEIDTLAHEIAANASLLSAWWQMDDARSIIWCEDANDALCEVEENAGCVAIMAELR